MTAQADLYDQLYTLTAQANHLKQLPRTGWLYAGIVNPESIAEHSFATALLVLHLGAIINEDWQAEALMEPLDVGQAVQIALVHDLAESMLTDLPKRSTDLIGKNIKHNAEQMAINLLVGELPSAQTTIDLWQSYEDASTPEARLVKDVDKLEMVFQAHRYEQRGHTNLSEFRRGHQWHYQSSQRFFEQIGSRK